MRVAIHQPNFMPHFGFFYKMAMSDTFVILEKVQFEKNGYQNRYYLQNRQKWVTMPVIRGLEPIHSKLYTNGLSLSETNLNLIISIKELLSIQANIVMDVATNSTGTQRLIDNLNHYGASAYVTNPTAKDKYLDEAMIKGAGIDIIYSSHPLEKLNILEMFEEYGITKVRDILERAANVDALNGGPK